MYYKDQTKNEKLQRDEIKNQEVTIFEIKNLFLASCNL